MPALLSIHAHVTRRPAGRLLVRLVIPGQGKPLWRCYAAADDSEAVLRATRHATAQAGQPDSPRTLRVAWWGWL